jgi:hypothetical protein
MLDFRPILPILTEVIRLTPYGAASLSFKSFRTDIRCTLRFEYGRYERCENKDDLELQAASVTYDIKFGAISLLTEALRSESAPITRLT